MAEPLSRELAQRVVDQVSPTLEHNINVMDRAGIIIASSDPSRVGTLHAEAARVAASGRPGSVAATSADGVRPGVNVPLLLDGAAVGVVGLTGDPERVGPIAQVLVLAITLLLERDHELDAAARREARDRDLLARLVAGDLGTADIAAALGSEPGRVRPPWCLLAVIGEASLDSAVPLLPAAHPEAARALERRPRHRWAAFGGVLWILGPAPAPRPHQPLGPAFAPGRDAVLDALGDALRLRTRNRDRAPEPAGAGAPPDTRTPPGTGTPPGTAALMLASDACPGPEELLASAAILAALVARPRLLPPPGGRGGDRGSLPGGSMAEHDAGARLLRAADLTAELAVGSLPPAASGHLARRARVLTDVQRDTAWAFLESGQSVSATARLLFTHRNTVLQRLERIGALTGLDPRNPRDAVTLRLAIVAARA